MRTAANYSSAAACYEAILASCYDYDALGRYVTGLLRDFAPGCRCILEIAAGACPMARARAYPEGAGVVYSDLSPAMLALADAAPVPMRAAADARALPFRPGFDACVMLMDAVNYLMDGRSVEACLREAFRVLKPGGVFILNAAGEAACVELRSMELSGEAEGIGYTVKSRYTSATRSLATEFILRPAEGGTLRELHVQKIHGQADLARWAGEAGFTLLGRYAGQSREPSGEDSRETHFVWARPG